jgi:hypothetical protein
MSDTIILEGYNQFKKRLEPAVLVDHKDNASILGVWLVARGIDLQNLATAQEVADSLYQACNAQVEKLLWKTKPAKLVLNEKEGKAQIQKSAAASAAEFAEKLKAGEKAEATKKAEAKRPARPQPVLDLAR